VRLIELGWAPSGHVTPTLWCFQYFTVPIPAYVTTHLAHWGNDITDLRQAPTTMSNALTTLTARFDSLQQVNSMLPRPVVKDNGRNQAAINGQHQQQPPCYYPVEEARSTTELTAHRKPASTAPATSLNHDFSAVAKRIYKMVQIRHHQNNWNTLPPSLSYRINQLADDIRPPMMNDKFNNDLRKLVTDFGDNIRHLVSRHLDSGYNDTQLEAGLLNTTDVERATTIADKYVNTSLRKGQEEALLLEAAEFVGILRQTPLQQESTNWVDTDGATWHTVQPRSPRATQQSTKRAAPESRAALFVDCVQKNKIVGESHAEGLNMCLLYI